MIKWLIENDNTEWYKPHFYLWRSDRMAENIAHAKVPIWTKNANDAWQMDTEEQAKETIEALQKCYDFEHVYMKATEHEFI